MRIKKDLIGKEVVDSNALVVGKIVDIDIVFNKNNINSSFYLIVSKGGSQSFRFKKEEIVIPNKFIKAIGDKIILSRNFKYSGDSCYNYGTDDFESEKEFVDKSKNDDFDLDEFEEEINDLKVKL